MTQNNWRQALARTRKATFGRFATLIGATELNDAYWEELETALIQADVGLETTLELVELLRQRARDEGITHADALEQALREILVQALDIEPPTRSLSRPAVIVLVGVNGSGKTTSVARLAHLRQASGERVLLAAADTYRAAASEQLQTWGRRLNADVIHGQPGSDPGAVVYSAIQAAQARDLDTVLVDTSGRMHTHNNLMAEVRKICNIPAKLVDGAPHDVLLVLDATTGQNGLAQARAFAQAVPLTGVILAKLDSSARGGIGFAVVRELGAPIRFVGLGESLEDLAPFDPHAYVDGLLALDEPLPYT